MTDTEHAHRDAVEAALDWRYEQRARLLLSRRPVEGPETMARNNLRILADRLKFPPGALEVCIAVQDDTGWWAFWNDENEAAGFERPACFSAMRRSAFSRDVTVYAPDEAGLRLAIEQAPPPRW